MVFKRLLLIGLLLGVAGEITHAQEVVDSLLPHRVEQVFFDFGKHELRPDADSVLDRVVEEARQQQNLYLRLTAHTDAIGSNAANLGLSRRRGKTVADSLQARGIPADRIEILEFGEQRPVASNASERGRQQNRRVEIAIYGKYPMTWLEGQVVDAATGEGISADLTVRTRYWKDSLSTDPDGAFRTPVPDQTVVGVDVQAKGYFFDTKMLKTNSANPKPLALSLPRAEAGQKVALKNLYFVGNQDILLERSLPELPKLLKFMRLNDTLKVEISGHINRPNHPPVDTSSWDFGLSVRRAKRIYEYLVKNGISPERMTYVGYGNWEMKYPKARSEKHQALNRRVEIKILGSEEVISEEDPN